MKQSLASSQDACLHTDSIDQYWEKIAYMTILATLAPFTLADQSGVPVFQADPN